jgi:hypothetical protein
MKIKENFKQDLFTTNYFTSDEPKIRPMTVGYAFSP